MLEHTSSEYTTVTDYEEDYITRLSAEGNLTDPENTNKTIEGTDCDNIHFFM